MMKNNVKKSFKSMIIENEKKTKMKMDMNK